MNPTTDPSAHANHAEPGFRGGPPDLRRVVDGARTVDISDYPGRLICIEGTDGVGRSTHIALLREWLESQGFGVTYTALTQSRLAGEGLRQAKQGHTLGQLTMDLYYATDLADRLERDILPALRAGFVVLTDRYAFSTMARSIVRGADASWIGDVFRFAPMPHATFYLRIDVEHLTPRVLASGGFDYWESGMDYMEETDLYRSFVRYQTRLLSVFEDLSRRYGFGVIDACRPVEEVFAELRDGTESVVRDMEGVRA